MEWFYILAFILLAWSIFTRVIRRINIGEFDKRYVLITGCDTGFGHLLAKQIDVLGFQVFACCLTENGMDKLKSDCSNNVAIIQMDVSKDESIDKAMEIVHTRLPANKGLWAVVNNAGIAGGEGLTSWQTRRDYINTMDVNLFGMAMVTKYCLPLVLKEKGRIVNTSSVSGRLAFLLAPYCMSKYGVEAFSDVLRREFYDTGVTVHIVEPGMYRTDIIDKDRFRSGLERKMEELPTDIKQTLPDDTVAEAVVGYVRWTNKWASKRTMEVVDAYIHAITAKYPRHRYVIGFDANFIYRPLWMLPEWISDWILCRLILS